MSYREMNTYLSIHTYMYIIYICVYIHVCVYIYIHTHTRTAPYNGPSPLVSDPATARPALCRGRSRTMRRRATPAWDGLRDKGAPRLHTHLYRHYTYIPHGCVCIYIYMYLYIHIHTCRYNILCVMTVKMYICVFMDACMPGWLAGCIYVFM